jgi:hypothetical protein
MPAKARLRPEKNRFGARFASPGDQSVRRKDLYHADSPAGLSMLLSWGDPFSSVVGLSAKIFHAKFVVIAGTRLVGSKFVLGGTSRPSHLSGGGAVFF